MSDFKALICILGVALIFVCTILYGFLFLIDRNGVPRFTPLSNRSDSTPELSCCDNLFGAIGAYKRRTDGDAA